MATKTMDAWISNFYQYIPCPNGADGKPIFPICRPYGTNNHDKNYNFGTTFWDGTYYKANSKNASGLSGYNARNKMLKTDYKEGELITNDDFNRLLTKIRQEFYLRDQFKGVFKPDCRQIRGSDNQQFFNDNDVIMKADYQSMYRDILALLMYEVEGESAINNNRIPSTRFSHVEISGSDYGNLNENGALLKAAQKNPSFSALNGMRAANGNNWWNGSPMVEYQYRFNKNSNSKYVSLDITKLGGADHTKAVVPIALPDDVKTNYRYGFTPETSRRFRSTANNEVVDKTVSGGRNPYGNSDYIAKNSAGNPIIQSNGYYQVSNEYNAMRKRRVDFVEALVPVDGKKIEPVMVYKNGKKVQDVDEYGNPKWQTLTKDNIQLSIRDALTTDKTSDGYTISIRAESINKYFMQIVNAIASTCICNCNYCSCFGHEASCVCYIVKVSGFCYSYQYEMINNQTTASPEWKEFKESTI